MAVAGIDTKGEEKRGFLFFASFFLYHTFPAAMERFNRDDWGQVSLSTSFDTFSSWVDIHKGKAATGISKYVLKLYVVLQDVAKLKAKGLQQENDLNRLRAIVKRQHEELQTSADNVLNLSGELREKGEEIAQFEEQTLL